MCLLVFKLVLYLSLCNYNIIVTTVIGRERVAAEEIKDILGSSCEVLVNPRGFKGLVLVSSTDPFRDIKAILEKNPYVEKAVAVEACCNALIDEIVENAVKVVDERIKPSDTFAVRTIRRGKHGFTSLQVNAAVGEAVLRKTNATVDLENPDYTILINIIQDTAYISLVKGVFFYKKMHGGKPRLYKVFRRMIVAQEPYLGPPDACFKMGERIGRALQSFEIGTYYIAFIEDCDAYLLSRFVQGLIEGIESRYNIQVKSYGRDVVKTKVMVASMYELVKNYSNHPIIILEPEGEFVKNVGSKLNYLLTRGKKPLILMGSRKGVPTGLYRFADLIIDVAPGITISTEYALPTALGAIATVIEGECDGDD